MRERYLAALKQGGHRITAQRRMVCEALAGIHTHPTPSEVYDLIARHHPEVSRATVYNTLNALRQLGAITEISAGDDHTHYETDLSPHLNLVCLRCHTVQDYQGQLPLNESAEMLEAETGFCLITAPIQILGFCRECQEQRRAEIREQATGSAEFNEN
jgi:Fur family transcriptional regulator, peroxide stress response regulator